MPRVGDPFFQARSSYDRRHDGTGLGLSIVKGLLALHGGDLEIHSRLGEGTRVTFHLPVDCAGVAARRAEAGGRTAHAPRVRCAGGNCGEEKCVVLAPIAAKRAASMTPAVVGRSAAWAGAPGTPSASWSARFATIAIVVNVLFMQKGSHPAPIFKGAPVAAKPAAVPNATTGALAKSPIAPAAMPRARPAEGAAGQGGNAA